MSESPEELDLFEKLSEEFVERARRGEAPSIEEYCRKYPSLADDIHELFPALVVIENARPEWQEQLDETRSSHLPDLDKIGD
ncbi:MAG: hypothetical protein AAF517_09925, partial [Planctomycetota bacterium]